MWAKLLRSRKSRRRWSPGSAAEVLENRILLTHVVIAEDDYGGGPHSNSVSGGSSVLDNDESTEETYEDEEGNETTIGGGALVAAIASDPSHGTVVMEENGEWTYTPEAGYVGEDSFTYTATDSTTGVSDEATVFITLYNVAPVWGEWDLIEMGEVYAEADAPIFEDSQIIGQIGAEDGNGEDGLTYWGSGSGVEIMADGFIVVVDAVAATAAMDAGGIDFAVYCSDGVVTISSHVVLDYTIGTNIIGQRQMWVGDSAGGEYDVQTVQELITVLEGIRQQGNTVTLLIIKGHGSADGIEMGDNVTFLTTAGDDIFFGDTEVTDLLNDVTDANSHISLRGCNTRQLAKRLKARLDGASVYGTDFWVLGLPYTNWIFGPGGTEGGEP